MGSYNQDSRLPDLPPPRLKLKTKTARLLKMHPNPELNVGQLQLKSQDARHCKLMITGSEDHHHNPTDNAKMEGPEQLIVKLKLPKRHSESMFDTSETLMNSAEKQQPLSSHLETVDDELPINGDSEQDSNNTGALRDGSQVSSRSSGSIIPFLEEGPDPNGSTQATHFLIQIRNDGSVEGQIVSDTPRPNDLEQNDTEFFEEAMEMAEMQNALTDSSNTIMAIGKDSSPKASSTDDLRNNHETTVPYIKDTGTIEDNAKAGKDKQHAITIGQSPLEGATMRSTMTGVSIPSPASIKTLHEELLNSKQEFSDDGGARSDSGMSQDSHKEFETHEDEEDLDENEDVIEVNHESSEPFLNTQAFPGTNLPNPHAKKHLQLQMKIQLVRQQMAKVLHEAKQNSHKVPGSFETTEKNGRSRSKPPVAMQSMSHEWDAEVGNSYVGIKHHPVPSNSKRLSSSSQSFNRSGQLFIPLTPNDWKTGPDTNLIVPLVNHPSSAFGKHEGADSVSDDDDDEPLKIRVKRRPSIMSLTSTITNSPPLRALSGLKQAEGDDDTINFKSITNTVDQNTTQQKNTVHLQRPLPQHVETPAIESSAQASENDIGSYTLPKFEVQCQPMEQKDDIPMVKVSIPNLVREELLLSPDHADQEVHLLLNLFIPGQQALAEPDPQPAAAVLNFHTIAVMVTEAFVQFEIGDQWCLGPRHMRASNEDDDPTVTRMFDAKDANVDEIFFAVIDRWRAGLESKKQNLSLIRGVQEFCDVALDVIYYIKENGLFKPEPKRAKSEKSTKQGAAQGKGVAGKKETTTTKTKGKKKADEAEDAAGNTKKGVKRTAEKKVNTLEPRKKAKTTKTTKAKSESKLTVTRKK